MNWIAKRSVALTVGLIVILGQVEKLPAFSPMEPDRFLLNASPDDCIAFFHNFGSKAPDPDSKNQTERFFANHEVQQLMKAIDRLILAGIDSSAQDPASRNMNVEDARLTYFWVKQLFTMPYTAYFSNIEFDESKEPIDVDAGIIFKPGDQMNAAKELLKKLVSSAPQERVVSTEILGVTCTQIKPKSTDQNEPSVFIAEHGEYFLVTLGNQSMHGALSRSKRNSPPTWLGNAFKRLKVPRSSFLMHVDLSEINRLLTMVDDPQFAVAWSELGFNTLTKAALVSGLNGEGSMVRGILQAEQLSGIFDLLDGAPLTAKDFSHIPDKVNSATAAKISLSRLLDRIRTIASNIDPDAAGKIDEGLGMVKAMTNIDLENDLIGALGDTWTVYQTGVTWMGLPQLTATVSTSDAQKLRSTHDQLMVLVKAQLAQSSQETEIAESEIAGNKVYFLRGLPIAPAWTVTDSQLVVASSSQVLKSHLTRNVTQSLAQKESVARRLNAKTKPIILGYNDMRTSLQRIHASLPLLTNMTSAELAKRHIEFDPTVIPSWETISPFIGPSVMSLHHGENELEFIAEESLPISSLAALGTPTLVALGLPAVQAARAAARRAQSINQAKQIVLATHNFEATKGRFPAAASRASNGKLGLSWRVHILPYLDERELYDEFHLDEPWDSEHNKALIKKIPDVYRSPVSTADLGKTNYLAVGGDDAVISGVDKGKRVSAISDGTARTILLLEVNDERATEWTKPSDFVRKPGKPAAGLGGLHAQGFIAGFADGSVRFIRNEIDPKILEGLFTIANGENIRPEDYE